MSRNQLLKNVIRAGLAAALSLGAVLAFDVSASAQFLPLRSWGNNLSGQLGNNDSGGNSTYPQLVNSPDSVAAIAAGYQHSLMLRSDGTVWAWGGNVRGELGYSAVPLSTFAKQTAGIDNVRAISAGGYTSYAVRGDYTVWAWGNSFSGELGNGTVDNAPHQTPVRVETNGSVPAPLTNISSVSAGTNHCLALTWTGSVYAWGWNFFGQLGGNSTMDSSRAVPVGIFGVTQVAAGGTHSLALKSDGTVWAWGNNDHGQLGDGTRINRTLPVRTNGLSDVAAVAGGSQCSAALKRDGTIWVWGFFQGTTGASGSVSPVQINGFANIKRFSLGTAHILAVDNHDDLYIYGSNERGQLGDPFVDYQSPAKKLLGLYHISAVAAGPDFSLIATFAAGLSGLIHLQGIAPSAENQVIGLTFYSDGNLPFVRYVNVSSDAFIQIENLPRRNYTIRIKGDKWLARTVNLDLRANNSTDLDVTLPAGDANGDNMTDIGDLLLLINHYNQAAPAENYLDAADFNCDGANDIADLLLLIGNYNSQGD